MASNYVKHKSHKYMREYVATETLMMDSETN